MSRIVIAERLNCKASAVALRVSLNNPLRFWRCALPNHPLYLEVFRAWEICICSSKLAEIEIPVCQRKPAKCDACADTIDTKLWIADTVQIAWDRI